MGHLKVNQQLEPSQGGEYPINVVVVAADTTLTKDDNDKTYILDNATGKTITLPALASGLKFKFIVGAAFATDNWIVVSAAADIMNGVVADMGSTVAGVTVTAADQVNFVASAETIGDWIEVVADYGNTQWLVSGMCRVNGGITATG